MTTVLVPLLSSILCLPKLGLSVEGNVTLYRICFAVQIIQDHYEQQSSCFCAMNEACVF